MSPKIGWRFSILITLALSLSQAHAANISISNVSIVSPSDPANTPQYAKLELLVALSNVAPATKPYNPDPTLGGLDLKATFTGPGSSVWPINGFYDGSSWRIRFSPTIVGAW